MALNSSSACCCSCKKLLRMAKVSVGSSSGELDRDRGGDKVIVCCSFSMCKSARTLSMVKPSHLQEEHFCESF